MGDLFDAALAYPAVLFSFPLLVVAGYWLFAAITGLASGAADGEDGDGTGGFAGFLTALGLGGVPVTVVLSLVIAVAWLTALAGTVLFGHPLLLTGWLLLALYTGWQATWLLARPLRRVLRTGGGARNADFVGRLCLVRIGCAAGRFGQGEVTQEDGTSALIDIRSDEARELPAGSQALIYDYDAEGDFFRVAPAGAAADPLG